MPARQGPLLSGIGVLVTRAPAQAVRLSASLASLGAHVFHHPVLAIATLDARGALLAASRQPGRDQGVIWTSANAIRHGLPQMPDTLLDALRSGDTWSACVGPATAEVLAAEGISSMHTASYPTASALAGWLCARDDIASQHILFPCSAQARPLLPTRLERAGARVTSLAVYRPVAAELSPAPVLDAITNERLQILTFASPSTVTFFLEGLGDAGRSVLRQAGDALLWAAIGPTTAAAIEDAGYIPQIVAVTPGVEGLVDAIVAHALQASR